ncbi:MAG: hypothetical protein NVS4B3_15440 [Gemmatimonadaceae bacterium]
MVGRSVVFVISTVLVTACIAAPTSEAPVPEAPSAFKVSADSMTRLVSGAAAASDAAAAQAQVALAERTPDRVALAAKAARYAVATANLRVLQAMYQGDRLRDELKPQGASTRAINYMHYWVMSRAKLDVAKTSSTQALAAADSAVVCTAPACSTLRAEQIRSQMQLAAGAAREAESLVRVAMYYLQ